MKKNDPVCSVAVALCFSLLFLECIISISHPSKLKGRAKERTNELTLFSSFVRNVRWNPPSIYVRTSWTSTGKVRGQGSVWMMTIFRKFYTRPPRPPPPPLLPVCCFPSASITSNEWHPSHDGTELFLARGSTMPQPIRETFFLYFCPTAAAAAAAAPFLSSERTEWPSGRQLGVVGERDGWNSIPKVLLGNQDMDQTEALVTRELIIIYQAKTGRKGQHRINSRPNFTVEQIRNLNKRRGWI